MLKNHLQAVIDKYKVTNYLLSEGITPINTTILIFEELGFINTEFKRDFVVAVGGEVVVFIEGIDRVRSALKYLPANGVVVEAVVPPFVHEYRWPGQEKPKADLVNSPKHYTTGKIEVAEFIEDQQLDWHLGTVIKYVCRAGRKDPTKEIEDLEKAEWYLRRKLELMRAAKEGRAPCRPNDMVMVKK